MDIQIPKPAALRGNEQEKIEQLWKYICSLVDFLNAQNREEIKK